MSDRVFQVFLDGDMDVTIVSDNLSIHGKEERRRIPITNYIKAKTKKDALKSVQDVIDNYQGDYEVRIHPVDKEHLESVVEMYKEWEEEHRQKLEKAPEHEKSGLECGVIFCSTEAKEMQELIDEVYNS